MKFRLSMLVDAFLGSGVRLGGDPITSFWNVSLLGLRTATVVNNCSPLVRDVVKVRFIATNCGERRLEIVFPVRDDRERYGEHSENNQCRTSHPASKMPFHESSELKTCSGLIRRGLGRMGNVIGRPPSLESLLPRSRPSGHREPYRPPVLAERLAGFLTPPW